MNLLKKRSRGYTSVSVLITVLVLALVMLLNTAFSVLAAHYSLFVDLTDTELWTLSDEAKKVIAEADGDITITFCHEKDYIESSSTMKYISGTAEEIAKAFPNVHVRYVNSILEPKLFEKYKYTDVSTIKTTSVIVESGSEFRVYAADGADSDSAAFDDSALGTCSAAAADALAAGYACALSKRFVYPRDGERPSKRAYTASAAAQEQE